MKIVVTDAKTVTNGDVSLDFLNKYGDVTIYELTSREDTAEHIKDAEMVICNKTVLDKEVLRKSKKLKYIGLFATGYNNIDTEYTSQNAITVCNAGSYSTASVAQQVFAFILNHYTSVAKYSEFVLDGGWVKSDTFSPFVYPMAELSGKTIGIVGFGNIGKTVAKIAQAFSMRVLVYTRTPHEQDGVIFTDFDTLVKQSDIVTPHCPLNEASKKMFDETAFSKMKDGAFFVNTARGGIMDETALCKALESGKLSGAGIDVLEGEPMSADCPLLKAKNITITPHVAWAPLETRMRLMNIVENNISSFIEGKPQNVVK